MTLLGGAVLGLAGPSRALRKTDLLDGAKPRHQKILGCMGATNGGQRSAAVTSKKSTFRYAKRSFEFLAPATMWWLLMRAGFQHAKLQ